MRLREFAQSGKAEIEAGQMINAFRRMLRTFDPGRSEMNSVGWNMIVIEALRDVKNVGFCEALLGKLCNQKIEIPRVGFVGADLFCCIDRIEFDAELRLAAFETLAVDIREDNQPIMLL